MATRSLFSRPIHLLAVLWFLIHIPTTLLVDIQSSELRARGVRACAAAGRGRRFAAASSRPPASSLQSRTRPPRSPAGAVRQGLPAVCKGHAAVAHQGQRRPPGADAGPEGPRSCLGSCPAHWAHVGGRGWLAATGGFRGSWPFGRSGRRTPLCPDQPQSTRPSTPLYPPHAGARQPRVVCGLCLVRGVPAAALLLPSDIRLHRG
jgi:hypothetical protein